VNLQAQAGVRIFGDGLGSDAPDLVERFAAEHRAGSAEEGRVPEVVAVLDDAVEELASVGMTRNWPRFRSKGSGE